MILPAEWSPQQATLLTWPHDADIWGNQHAAVQQTFSHLIALIARFQPVILVIPPRFDRHIILAKLQRFDTDPTQIYFFEALSNDCWARDHGPIGVHSENGLEFLDFRFNGWGEKFPSQLDNRITRDLYRQGALGSHPIHTLPFVLEGGSIETDGCGTLLTTRRCLLSPQRNPGLAQHEIEAKLRQWLGVDRFLWLDHGALEGDDTDSHIDILARFCDPETIVYTTCSNPSDSQYDELCRMKQELESFRDCNGEPYHLFPLPIPRPIHDGQGRRLAATYANFVITNGQVIVPVYNDPMDQIALETLQRCFPDRRIAPLDARSLIHQGGSLHCVTMHIPAENTPDGHD